jgi:hypothetical protein
MFHLDRIKSIAQEGEHAVSADVQKFVAYLEQKWAAMTHSIETLEEHAADAVRYFEGAKAAKAAAQPVPAADPATATPAAAASEPAPATPAAAPAAPETPASA